MLLLPPESKLAETHLLRLLEEGVREEGGAPDRAVDLRFGDFDDCYWRIEITEGAPNLIRVCLTVPGYSDIKL